MTAMFLALAPVSGLALVATAAPAQAQQAEISVSLFFDQLAPHGRWAQHPRWGWVWYPTAVDAGWRPYTRGNWVWTEEYGWYWNSEETFGWATYHYGRWGYDEVYGWVWVPGERWAPAWVAFRYSDQAIGWAPLPPETLDVTSVVDADESIFTAGYYQPRWVFVEPRYFVTPDLYTYVAPSARNAIYIRASVNITNIRISGDVFVNRSFEPQRIRAAVGRDIPRVRVQRVNTYNNVTVRNQPNTVNVYNPRIRLDRDRAPPERARARDTDRPRVTVRPDLVRPDDRRDGRGRDTDRGTDRAAPNDRTPAQPSQPPRAAPDRDRATPGTPPASPPRQAQPDRERTPPGAPGATPPSATPPRATPPTAAPPARPGQPARPGDEGRSGRGTDRERDANRGAQPARPAQPPAAAPSAPPSRVQPPARPQPPAAATPSAPPNRAQPPARPQPPAAAPAAPPSRAQPPARPPQAQPSAPPQRSAPPAPAQKAPEKKKDDEKKEGR